MTDALKKQVCYAGGTLGGWLLAKAVEAKEVVPFTILGGLAGFALAESLVQPHPRTARLAGVPRASHQRRKRAGAIAR